MKIMSQMFAFFAVVKLMTFLSPVYAFIHFPLYSRHQRICDDIPNKTKPRHTSDQDHHVILRDSVVSKDDYSEEKVEVIVIGSGLGGLSCAALTSKYRLKTLCLEAHDTPGGCAHSFQRYSSASKTVPFCFDSGPSLISGLSKKSTNPLRQLLDAVGTSDEVQWCTYDGWLVHDTSDGVSFRVTTGNGGKFEQAIEHKAGIESRRAFEVFRDKLLAPKGLAEASTYIPPFALRGGLGAVASLARYMIKLMSVGSKGTLLTGPFSKCLETYQVGYLLENVYISFSTWYGFH
jgi:NAD(P)-binding Rossmann-like domain